jgi:hypothetical protein
VGGRDRLLESLEKVLQERSSYPEVQQQLHQLRQQLGQPELVAAPTGSAL